MVAAARDAFWARGICATSIADLGEATGLSVGSLYKAFASKDGLCHRTLDGYLVDALAELQSLFDSRSSAIEGLEAWFDAGAERAASTAPTRGCYAVTCAMELAERDETVRRRLQDHDRQLRAIVADQLRAAKRDSDISIDPEIGARLVCTTMNGLQVESRKGISLDDARSTLAALRLALG